MLKKESIFPGWNALYPTIGAALLIGWANGTTIGRILSLAPVVWVGKISYSFYLWHWPLIVFWKLEYGQHLSTTEKVLLFFLSIALAAVSTHFIEKPFRSQKLRQTSAKTVVMVGVLPLLAMAALGALASQKYLTFRSLPDHVSSTASAIDYRTWPDYQRQFRTGQCFLGQANNGLADFIPSLCTSVQSSNPNILVIGDSHAAQFWGAFTEILPDINIMQATASGCKALIGSPGQKRCTEIRDWVFEVFLPSNHVDAVVIAGRWTESDLEYLPDTINQLEKFTNSVIVVGPTVEYQGPLPTLLARSQLKEQSFNFSEHLTPGRIEVNEAMRKMTEESNATYIDILSTLCHNGECTLFAKDHVPMQFDYGHLTLSGAVQVLQEHRSTILEAIPSPTH